MQENDRAFNEIELLFNISRIFHQRMEIYVMFLGTENRSLPECVLLVAWIVFTDNFIFANELNNLRIDFVDLWT